MDLSRVRITGPLAAYGDGFREELAVRGYAESSAAAQLRLMAHLSRWLDAQGLDAGGLTPQRVEQFREARRRERSNLLGCRALGPLVEYLRTQGAVAEVVEPARTWADRLLVNYRVHLVSERGLAASTVDRYLRVARRFLLSSVADEGEKVDLQGLTAADLNRFLTHECQGRPAGSVRNVASSLRALLRFLHVEGLTDSRLDQAVLAGPVRRDSSLPRAVETAVVERLLAGCDRRRAMGRRDYAVLVLLSRMGLRAGEVAGLELDDIDWRRGELAVRGKGRRDERLPLPTDVGEALAGYLARGRPRTGCRRVFVRVRAPFKGLGVSSISTIVYRACDRAGLPRVGAHRLRHTTATELLRQGASLSEVGQVLGHHGSAQTTAIYARVDHQALGALVVAWPGGAA